MKRDTIDRLIQLAYLEGTISTRKAYETAVARRQVGVTLAPGQSHALQRKLEQALENKIGAADLPLTIGSLLKRIRTEQSLRPQDIFSRIGVTSNIYLLLERDRISPLKISVDVWQRIKTLLDVPVEQLSELVRRTHQLVFFRPSFRTTLARYDAKKNKAMKASSLEKATAELYAKAHLDLPEGEKERLDTLLKSIAGGK